MIKTLIYSNPLSCADDVKSFVMEGIASISFPNGRMRMENLLDPSLGQKSNFVYWCDKNFPSDIEVEWDFYPVSEPGLCMLFFAAQGSGGEDLFSPNLAKREGEYPSYHSGDINAYHVSYFRRKAVKERGFNVCNLRKSSGFHLVAQGADPIPTVADCIPPYTIKLVKFGNSVEFFIRELKLFTFEDDGISFGKPLGDGKIGFRQMAPLVAEYANLRVYALN